MTKLSVCSDVLKHLLSRIKEVEGDAESSSNDKLLKVKKIREEISKVGEEIDSIKKDITLLNSHSLN